MSKILLKFPSRSRPQKFFAALDNIFDLSVTDDLSVLASFDLDDCTMNNDEVREILRGYPKVKYHYGTSRTKIQAVNADMDLAGTYDVLLVHSDDMHYTIPGFDLVILEAFKDFKGLVHFPDQKAGPALITYPMMHREYFERDGWIYHPDFISVYSDHFQQDIAKRRGLYKYVNKKILEHRHSMWGFGTHDPLMLRNENRDNYNKDQITWQRLLNDPKYA
jgi:hypothetical protein